MWEINYEAHHQESFYKNLKNLYSKDKLYSFITIKKHTNDKK